HLADLYALGVTAFELLAGAAPFPAPTVEARLLAHVNQPVPDVRRTRGDVPERLARLIRELMGKKPEDRPQSSEEVLWRLQPRKAAEAAAAPRVLIVEDDAEMRA